MPKSTDIRVSRHLLKSSADIAELINGTDDLEVVGAHGHVDGAVDAAIRVPTRCGRAHLGDGTGVEACRELWSHYRRSRAMITSLRRTIRHGRRLLAAAAGTC